MVSTRFLRGLLAVAATIAAVTIYAVLTGGSGGAGSDALLSGRRGVPLNHFPKHARANYRHFELMSSLLPSRDRPRTGLESRVRMGQ